MGTDCGSLIRVNISFCIIILIWTQREVTENSWTLIPLKIFFGEIVQQFYSIVTKTQYQYRSPNWITHERAIGSRWIDGMKSKHDGGRMFSNKILLAKIFASFKYFLWYCFRIYIKLIERIILYKVLPLPGIFISQIRSALS